MDTFQKAIEDINETLIKNGVSIKGTFYGKVDSESSCLVIEGLDFSEHDKEFLKEIERLKQDISAIKSRCTIETINSFEKGNYSEIKVLRLEDYEASKKMFDECCEENARLNKENEKLRQEIMDCLTNKNTNLHKNGKETVISKDNIISHPSHYCDGRKYEPKDVIRDWGLNFNLGSACKYLSRAGRKGDIIEDLEKAKQFIQFEIDYLNEETE